ncbi:MAG: hypothetical protein WCG94_00310 [Methanothrix sp.]
MIWKAALILIYFLSSAFAASGLIHLGIQQADCNAPIKTSSNGDLHGNYYSENGQLKSFWWPNQNGVNIANINGGTGYINQNINQNYLADSYQSASTKLMSVSGTESNEHASYTINFFNINYGLLRDKLEDPLHRSWLQRYPPSMKEALKQSAENARILEKDRKENIELLKRIAS